MLWEGAGTQEEEAALEHSFFLEEAFFTYCLSGWPPEQW